MNLDYDLLKRLPKAELHVHLDGSLRIPTIFELAEKYKVKLPSDNIEGFKKAINAGEVCKSLEEYLTGFGVTLSVMQTEESLFRVAYELAEDAAEENVKYMEVRFSPILHQNKNLKLTAVTNAVLEGLAEAEKKFDIKTNVIICGIRNISPEVSLRLAELTVAFKNKGVIAFDLAGAEVDYPAKHHAEAFKLTLKNNINTTLHAGEAMGPESIHQALHYCGAHRIGHGTSLIKDGDLLNYVNDHRIPLEICLLSNYQTGAVQALEDHPFPMYFDYGLRVTLNTDNRLISDTTLTNEYKLAVDKFGLSYDDVIHLILDSFKSGFLPYHARTALLRKAKQELLEIKKTFLQEHEDDY